jgi:geranylgeranyl pyrophosphate synthase
MSKPESPTGTELVSTAMSDLQSEVAAVELELVNALADLRPPFSRLVASQLKRMYPLVRGALVLSAGVGAPDSLELRAQRICLGAAIEMLHLAVGIHTRLLPLPGSNPETDRSILGSAILAGDFCFSRAAALAVRTGSSAVVDVFAQALQRVSEGYLRHSFSEDTRPFDENRELFASGTSAAGMLAGYSPLALAGVTAFGVQVADDLRNAQLSSLQVPASLQHLLAAPQAARWQALVLWLQWPSAATPV